jgi:transcription elongation GreA/GreB family factor
MREEFEKLAAAGKILNRHIGPLVTLAENRYCRHRSWGFGQIREVDTALGRFVIDFVGKPGHSMDLAFAAESLTPLGPDHILVRKATDLAAVKQMAALHHLDLIKLVLQSFNGRATVDQIQQVLVPDVIAADWKKWWEAAKREMKRDGHFLVPAKKAEPVIYQAEETNLRDRLLGEFRKARGLKARLLVVAETLASLADLPDKAAVVREMVEHLNPEIASHQRTQPALALEAIFLRDDLRVAAGLPPSEGEVTEQAVWSQAESAGKVLELVTASKHRRALASFKAAHPDTWQDVVLGFLNSVSAKLCGECANLLIESGQRDRFRAFLSRAIAQHSASSELLLWLARSRSDEYADILGPEVFRAMLSAIERDEKKAGKLRDFIMDDSELLVELIESADIEVIKDLTRALQLSPSFDDMDKRSLLARIIKHFPAIQSLVSGESARQDNTLVVSWESLERRKREYDELVQKKIPANSRDIAIARSYGDLSENHEYKAAKEMHGVLMRRKGELERDLARARGSDLLNPRTDVVSIGTRVTVTELGKQHTESLTLLGAWDFDPERHVVSYLSPIGQALLNRKVGDEIELDLEGHISRYRIETIEPALTPPPEETAFVAPPPSSEPASPPTGEPAGGIATAAQVEAASPAPASSAVPESPAAEPGGPQAAATATPG